ncbi:MAG: energy coupling factor transporter S component ThiW [Tissierellia bacterium]|nr:energy coupling factor transporter S component ThiW [Tissierellia bacterium]
MNIRQKNLRKLMVTPLFSACSFILCTFVVFPNMAPFQHFVNVLAGVIIGPWYAFAAALLTGLLRMMTGRSILSVIGAIFGALLSGYFYKYTKKIYMAFLGEVIGTGIISALVSYPVMRYVIGLPLDKFYYYIPFFLPSAAMGGALGMVLLYRFKKTGQLAYWLEKLN